MKKTKTTYFMTSRKPIKYYTIKLFKDGFAEDACIPTTAFTNKKIELCFLQHPKYSSNINLKFPKPYMYIHVYA